MEGNAAGMVLRLALKTRFSEMGWSSTLLPSANITGELAEWLKPAADSSPAVTTT